MESVYEICYYGGLVLAIILLITAVVLFIVLKIPKVFGELTGRSASKSVNAMKSEKGVSRSASKMEKEKYYGHESGRIKVRETVAENKRKDKSGDAATISQLNDEEETIVLGAEKTINAANTEETEVLLENNVNEAAVTEVLQSNKFKYEEATEVLNSENSAETTAVLLDENMMTNIMANTDKNVMGTTGYSSDSKDVESAISAPANGEGAAEVPKNSDDGEGATAVLMNSDDGEETTTVLARNATSELAKRVKVLYNIIITHTEESL